NLAADYKQTNPDGTPAQDLNLDFNPINLTAGLTGTFVAPPSSTPQIGLSFGTDQGEYPVTAYSTGVDSSSGLPNFSAFQVSLPSSSLEGRFLNRLARQNVTDPVTIHVRNDVGLEYLTYTLPAYTVTSLTTTIGSEGDTFETVGLKPLQEGESFDT